MRSLLILFTSTLMACHGDQASDTGLGQDPMVSAPSGVVSAGCLNACHEAIDDAEEEQACATQLELCESMCMEITSGATGACLGCLAEAIWGPALPATYYGEQGSCWSAEFDTDECIESCG